MKKTFDFGINIVIICLFFGCSTNFALSQDTRCDVPEFRTCFHSLIDTAFASLSQNVADVCSGTLTNVTADRECVTSFLSQCSSQIGREKSALISQYAQTLEDVFTVTCDQEFLFTQPEVCDAVTAVDCLKDFSDVLVSGTITTTCRQLEVTLPCVRPSLESCTDRSRYFLARILNDLQLTHDTICYESGCNLDIARECVQDAHEIYDYPITIVSQSALVCNKMKSSLACAYNHTYTCVDGVIPPGLVANYDQLVMFTTAYCGMRMDSFMLADIPEDLKSTIVLASLSTNRWASVESICSIYNETLLRAANEGKILTQYTRDLLTWQNAMKINLDKYGGLCFTQHMADCDWIERLANDDPVCEPKKAEGCFDLVLLSKLVVETKVKRSTWETACVAMLNQASCAQYHTGACSFNTDLSAVAMVTAEVENLLGYECSQLGIPDRPDMCDEQTDVCDVHGAIKNCADIGNSTDICRDQEAIVKCFKDYTSLCNSVRASTAQFYMEWVLNDCTVNATVIPEDTLGGVAACNLQFGYTIYNGLMSTTNFGPLLCNALTVFGACISQQTPPALATFYLNQYGTDLFQIQFAACNSTTLNLPDPPEQEAAGCPIDELVGKVSLAIQVSSTFPLLSVAEQDEFCSMISTPDETPISDCSQTRQGAINAGRSYLSLLYGTFCSVTRSDLLKQCDVPTLQMCFENFGGFTYFSNPDSDICGQLEESYSCIYEHAKGCDSLESAVLQEVKVMKSIVGNITCPQLSWCNNIDNTSESWMTEICLPTESACDLLNWSSCVEETGFGVDFNTFTCLNQPAATACVERKLSGCDPIQYTIAKAEMFAFGTGLCQLVPVPDPVDVQPIHEALVTCYNTIKQVTQYPQVSKSLICSVLSEFQVCVGSLNQAEIPSVWQGVLSKSKLMWEKELYLHCQISSSNDEFIVDPDFNRNEFFGSTCNANQGSICLYNMLELLVSYQPFVPMETRFTDFCQRFDNDKTCVIDQTSGCILLGSASDQSLVTTAEWVTETADNIGTCSDTWREPRFCDPDAAIQCMAELGQSVARIDDEETKLQACSKLQSTTICVHKKTSGCNYNIKSELEATLHEISTVTRQICTAPPVSSENSCINQGETITCDVEEALMCLISVQTLLLQDASFQQVCGSVPKMKTCVHRHTTGCDEHIMLGLEERLHVLSHRMYDQCPYIYCDECKARQCLENLHQVLRYQDVNLCLAVSETKQCINNYAGYCDGTVMESLMGEMMLLVGEEGQVCDVAIETCLQSLFDSAIRISNYNPQYYYMNQNMSAIQTDVVFAQMCQEANTAYFCVDYHLSAYKGTNMTGMVPRNLTENDQQRVNLLNATLQTIGDVVSKTCQGPRLECYSCVNATSNEECNMKETQSCPLDKQMCGTMIMDNSISKGCVSPMSCQSGCVGEACMFCCEGDMCNQPWNSVLQEPETCQPQNALWCGFELLYSLVQNDTVNCRVLQESLSCMSESTKTCLSHDSVALGIYAQNLMSGDIMSTCMNNDTSCGCGQCSSVVLLSVITSPYKDVEAFCKTIWRLYNNTVEELDINTCDIMTLQSTAYNLEVAAYLANGICNVQRVGHNCSYNGTTYRTGTSFTAADGCNTCTCMDGQVGCTLMYCPPQGDSCYYNNQMYENGDSFKDADDCNTCTCFNGYVGCTRMYCPPEGDYCLYNKERYETGDSFMDADGCNTCNCYNGYVSCTEMYCPPNGGNQTGSCDIYDMYSCMTEADLFNKVARLTTNRSPALCSSAAGMLRCLDPKVGACSYDVLYIVRGAVMENLNAIQMYCDVYDILANYGNWDRNGNETEPEQPGPDKPGPGPNHSNCSIEKGLRCFELEETDDKCGYYQSLIDCVYNFTTSCMSVDAVPVTFQLQYMLQTYSMGCDLDIPSRPIDPLFPIAQCTMDFASALTDDLSGSYLPYQQLESTCGHLEEYGNCLYSAQLPPLGQLYIMKIEHSMSMLVHMCEEYNNPVTNPCAAVSCVRPDCDMPYTPEGQCCPVCPDTGTLHCHNCSMTTDVEGCDSKEPETCQPYQVCGTVMEMEPNSGATMVRKGCADPAWCQTWMGCDPNTMTCVSCCYGNMCNKATPPPGETTRRPQITTVKPQESCNLQPISTFMVIHILRLMNHDIMPLRERQYACRNVTTDLGGMLDDLDLDPKCSPDIKEHVTVTTELLNIWTSNVCENLESETKCMEAVQCMENFGNFPDKNATCRTLESIQKCLRTHFKYCGEQDRAALNQTSQLLSNMEHLVCVPNKLADNKTIACVNVTEEYAMKKKGMCNVTRVQECMMSLEKASHNPFVKDDEFCRLAKSGMKCLQDNTFNCSAEVTQSTAPYLTQVVSYVSGRCPETWCQEATHCKLEMARECLHHLEEKIVRATSGEEFDKDVCMEFSRTHDCIMNATYECHPSDMQMVVYNFTQMALHVAPACLYQPPNVTECGITFLQTVNSLIQYDDVFLLNLANTYSDFQSNMDVMQKLLSEMFPEPDNGSFPGNRSHGNETFTNPYIRNRRDAHGQNGTNGTKPEEEFWNDNKTRPLNTTTNSTEKATETTPKESERKLQPGALFGLNIPFGVAGNEPNLRDVLSELDLDYKDLGMLFDVSVLTEYNMYKSRLCQTAQQAHMCLEQGTRQVFFTGNQEYIVNMSLGLLRGVAMDKCESMQMCHACNGLRSNAECNRQTPVACSPIQMCMTRSTHGNITKGCTSMFTCEEECRHSDQPCYCCQGNMCNKMQVPREGQCNVQAAVKCTQDLLTASLYGDMEKRSGEMRHAATCMMEATEGCHGDTLHRFYEAGKTTLTLLSAAQCVKNYGSSFCGSSDAVTLAAIVSNPYRTPVTMEMTCSLYNNTLRSYYMKEKDGKRCDNTEEVVRAFKTIYAEIKPYCRPDIITNTCSLLSTATSGEKNETKMDENKDRINNRMTDKQNGTENSQNATTTGNRDENSQNSTTTTGRNETETGSDVIEMLCSSLEIQSEGVCEVSTALVSCFLSFLYEENPICNDSNPDYAGVFTCVEELTSGCVDTELLPIYVMHSIVCGGPLDMEDKNSSTSDLIDCLQVAGDLVGILTSADDVYGRACDRLQEAGRCLDSAHISPVDMMLIRPMFVILEEFKKGVCSLVVSPPEVYTVECTSPSNVTCNGSVCDSASCPAYHNAICVEDGCDACQPRFFFRGEEVTQNCTDVIVPEVCDYHYLTKETMINLFITASLDHLSLTEQAVLCSLSSFMDILKDNASTCPSVYGEPLINLLSWTQGKLDSRCYSNALSNACVLPSCDVTAAAGYIGKLGSYLKFASMDDHVFCQKMENTLKAVECSLTGCVDEDQMEVETAFLYMRSIVYNRCPTLTASLYCHSDDTQGNETDPVRPTNGTDPTSRPPTANSTGSPTTGAPPTNNTDPPRSRRSAEGEQRGSGDRMDPRSKGEEMACSLPMCSYDEAEACIKTCSSVEETSRCMSMSTAGCNPVHKYAIYSILKYTSSLQGTPRECWVDVNLQTNTSYASGYLQCIEDFTDRVDMALMGNSTVSPCDLFVPLMECMATELASPDVPRVLADNLGHVIMTASPSIGLICSHQEDSKRKPVHDKVSDKRGDCHVDTASICLNYFSVNTLLNPALLQGSKQWTCKNLDITRSCIEESVKGCPKDKREFTLSVYNAVQAMAIMSGTCAPKPFICEPAETLQCIAKLAHVVQSHGVSTHQGDVCHAIEHMETCFKQTTSYCDRPTMGMLNDTLNPIKCQAYTICPMAADKPKMLDVEPPQSVCLPVDDKRMDGKCNTGSALQCLYQFYSDKDEAMYQGNDMACSLYADAVSCFYDNIQGCTDDFSISMSIMVFESWKADAVAMCPQYQGKLFCDLEEKAPDCGLYEVDACFDTLMDVFENGNANEMCLAKREAERCLEYKLSSCPYFVKMYGKAGSMVRAEKLKLTDLYDSMSCDSIQQCSYAYTSLFQEALLAGRNNVDVEVEDVCQTFKYREEIYPCKARGQDLSCIYSNLGDFPVDVAMVINMTVSHLDGVFSDVCGALLGSQFTSVSLEETECYLSGVQSYLPLLVSFVDGQRETNISSFSSFEFCSTYADWMVSFETYQARDVCVSSNTTVQFNQWFMTEMSQLKVTYCTRPCNTTSADLCLETLEEAIANQTAEEVCDVYKTVKTCIEEAISSCTSDVSDQFFTEAETMFNNAAIRCYVMPSVEVSFPDSLSDTSNVFEIMEAGAPLQFSVSVASSVSNSCFGTDCQLEFSVEIDGVPTISCASGEIITQFLADTCVLYFNDQSTGPETLTFDLRIDHRIETAYNATFNFVAKLWEDNVVVKVEVVDSATVMVKEEQTGGLCDVVSDPMITTFDGLDYFNFRQGELILYQHDTLPEKVHIFLQRCSLFSYIACPCAAMVMSGDDTFVVDTCRRYGETFHPIEFRVYQNDDLTPHTKVHESSSKQSYQFVLPSGTIVYVDMAGSLLDVSIKPSSVAWGHTSGLCGTYDGNPDDDLAKPDGTITDVTSVPVWSGAPVPSDFTIAWTPTSTLFFGSTAESGLTYVENTRCDCTGLPCIETDLVETCDLVSVPDITSNLTPYLEPVITSSRRKRQAEDPSSIIDVPTDNSGAVPNITWPTASGIMEVEATQQCNDAMQNSLSWEACGQVVDTSATLQACLASILLTDSYNSTSTVIENMLMNCQIAIQSDPSILVSLNTTIDKLFPYTFSCPNNCSSTGSCVNGTCQCMLGYIGDDCSILSSTPPTITTLSESVYSVEQGNGDNTVVSVELYVYGENFINSDNLTCHTEEIQIQNGNYTTVGVTKTTKAMSLTFGQAMCSVTGTLPLTGLLVSVSNNGVNRSDPFIHIIQDSVCYSCNAADVQCPLQAVSCIIDSKCYGPGVYNPDDGCYLCDPISNVWQYKTSPTCPAPTTSTVTTSTLTPTTTATPAVTTTTPAATTKTTTITQQPGTTRPATTTQQQTTTQPQTTTTAGGGSIGNTDGQGGNQGNEDDDDEDNTTTIVIVVASVLGGLLIITVIIMAFKLRKADNQRRNARSSKYVDDSSSSADSSDQMSGHPNPTFDDAEDPARRSPRRDYAGRPGPFNPQGLSGESAYRQSGDAQNIDVAMFEQQGIPRPQVSNEPYPDYNYDVIKRGSEITRQAQRGDPLYDNANRKAKADKETDLNLKERIAPRAGYAMEDSALRPNFEDDENSITHL